MVVQLRQNHKKTSWSDEKLTITLPATTFHASSTLPSCRSALRGKTQCSPNCTPDQLLVNLLCFRTFLLPSGNVFHPHIARLCRHSRDNRQQEATTMSEIDRSSGALIAVARTRTVGDYFGRFFCNLARDEPSSLLTEISMNYSNPR